MITTSMWNIRSLCLFLRIYRIYSFLKYGNIWLWKCLKKHNWGIPVLSSMFINQKETHYSVTVKWNLSLSLPSQWLVWIWKKKRNTNLFLLKFILLNVTLWLLVGWLGVHQTSSPTSVKIKVEEPVLSGFNWKHPNQDQHHNWDSVVYLVLSLWFVISLTGIKATDTCSEGSRAICKHPSKTRMSTSWYWEGGRGQLGQQGPGGLVGCAPFVMLPWNPITRAAR